MILYLVRRNLPSFIAALFSVFAAFSFVVAPRIAPVEALPFFIVIYGAIPRRGSIFEASLPIRGREIVAARVLWILALVWFPIVAWLVATAGSDLRALPAGMVLDAGAALTLAVLLPCAIQPEQVDEPPVWLTALLWIALAAPSAAVAWFLPPAVSMATFAIAIAVAARWIWSRIPDALEVAPRKAAVGKKQVLATSAATSPVPRSAHAWKPLLFFLLQSGKNQSGNPSYLILLMYGAMFTLGLGSGDRFQPLVLFYVLLPIGMARQGTRWLTAFPISNRARLWCVLVPGVVIAMGCVGLGGLISSTFFRNQTSMSANAPGGSHYRDDLTRVPLEFWTRATGQPVIRAPWGETAMADTLSVLRVELQNPYTTNVGNSPRFVEWQFQRATIAVYGHPMTIAQYQRRKAEGALPPDVRNSPRMQILNLATIMAVVLLIALLSELGLWYRIGRSRGGTYGVYLTFTIPFLVFFGAIALDFIYAKYPMSSVSVSIAESALMRLSSALPENLAVLAIISALPLIALYAMLEWQFDRAESIDPKRSGNKFARLLARPAPFFRTS